MKHASSMHAWVGQRLNAHGLCACLGCCFDCCQVGTVYNNDNIWANVQDSGHPWDINWHLGDTTAWKPFFGPVLPLRELASIQVR
jgi:hypothetical protein